MSRGVKRSKGLRVARDSNDIRISLSISLFYIDYLPSLYRLLYLHH